MVRKKRSYKPKVKGCYQCSQRRVDCDGARPCCNKCVSRGLSCSGFEFRYKFLDGLSKGNKRRKEGVGKQTSPPCSFSRVHRHDSESDPESPDSDNVEQPQAITPDESLYSFPIISGLGDVDATSFDCELDLLGLTDKSHFDEALFWDSVLLPELALVEPWKEFLMTYFSENIAPEMVVVDDDHNGWRNFVLPLAYTDDLIMSTVLAVSATHLSGTAGATEFINADGLYGRAIRGLQDRKNLDECDDESKHAVILSIIVLLVAVMVNGCSDFPIMFQMLESAIDAIGGEAGLMHGGDVAAFALRQIRKMRVYAAPLLSREAGVRAVQNQAQRSFDCLRYYSELHPDHLHAFAVIGDLQQQAFNIYLNRVNSDEKTDDGATMIEEFISTMQAFPEGSPGKHVLVWPVFIAALESKEPGHRQFLETFLQDQNRRNGFGNIVEAIRLLKRIWACDAPHGWPAVLPEPQVFIM